MPSFQTCISLCQIHRGIDGMVMWDVGSKMWGHS